ncbi:MAG: acetate kinase [Candidatus Omnitrophica bacterium]|nr:acetate kinase [Candidatus Omnitrophota bacterium]
MLILVLNCGSSSVKYQLYDMPGEICLAKGIVEKIGVKTPNHNAAVKRIISSIKKINAVGHRVVHGGERFKESTIIDKGVIKAIKQYSRLAPLHNSPNLAGIYACKRLFPRLAQAAVFDTAFHQTMPAYAYLYGLPYAIYKKYGIRRYGFHGTSHRYVAGEAGKILRRPLKSLKIITCHLGNGCSITAVDKGESVDTSMGFTPLEGLVMGTRCGDIDPAAVLYLMKKKKLSISRTDELLNKFSGLLGLSGKSRDMRDILSSAHRGNQRANLALEVFIYRIRKYIGAYIAAMNGCDALVFTAGIGENSPYVRREVCRHLSSLIKKFKMRILVIPTNEELMIARDTYRLVR